MMSIAYQYQVSYLTAKVRAGGLLQDNIVKFPTFAGAIKFAREISYLDNGKVRIVGKPAIEAI